MLGKVTNYIGFHAVPGDPILVFPYQTAFGMTSRHRVAGGVLQSYLVNGDYLTGLELEGLRQLNPASGVYFPDGLISVGVDFVPNFTRSPDVWFYLLRNYRLESSPVLGAVGLTRDDTRNSRVTLSARGVTASTETIPIHKRSTTLEILRGKVPAAGTDFLKLKLRVNYPPWWRLRKPSKLTLQMSFADGSQKTIEFVMAPNRTNEIWVYPWDDKKMGQYFADDPTQWRLDTRTDLAEVKLLVTPFDWLSVVPSSVTIEGVEAVEIVMQPPTSSSLP